MTSIDITLISGRRPELLAETLASFSQKLFSFFEIDKFIVNIDPFGGNDHDHKQAIGIVKNHFSSAIIIEPNECSFGKAVQQAWLKSEADFIFHLEDDWLLEEQIKPDDIFPLFQEDVAAVQLVSKEHSWNGETFKMHKKMKRVLGIPLGTRTINVFGTSPAFWRGAIARKSAELLDTNLDPEKQMRPPLNPKLFKLLNDHKCRMLPAKNNGCLITDIGRQWRADRNLMKVLIDGKSTWVRAE